ncbi:Metallo-dependent hydrolase [Leucogyrophana mollusca]|uniref:Metallo-dependent hydrolase n=1 Tax=Leucogyrophana mollusca TaxID=85980 RepID=A0ACB8BNB9_9AGAM|nr:Metallo-dependent hydrolase [Leucogyrophana mollusca]
MATIYYGSVINPKTLTDYDALPRCLIAVTATGNIDWIVEDVVDSMVQETIAQHGLTDDTCVVTLKPGEFIMPGFIDTHTHAVQVPNLGIGGEFELLDWLNNYTFPTESRFESVDYAKRSYPDIVRRVINSGTTTCCYYGSLHLTATKVLADVVHEYGQRAFVGRCNMNWHGHSPDYYVEKDADESMENTVKIIDHIRSLPHSSAGEPLVHPILTPRFAMSCTPDLLVRLGEYAAEDQGLVIQTHISENKAEVEKTLELFKCDSYAGVYDRYKLLRHNTILGHGVHLTEHEMRLIHKRGAGVSHCPTSNFYLSSGMARVGMLLDHGVKVGLGTDVAGGYSPSILSAIQHASIASKMLAIQDPSGEKCSHGHHGHHGHGEHCQQGAAEHHEHGGHEHGGHGHGGHHNIGEFTNQKLSIATLLYLATLGGAELCCLKDRIGSFKEGKAFDALLVSIRDETGNPAIWGFNPGRDVDGHTSHEIPRDPLKEGLERFLFCGDDRNIRRVIVQGKVIGGQELKL